MEPFDLLRLFRLLRLQGSPLLPSCFRQGLGDEFLDMESVGHDLGLGDLLPDRLLVCTAHVHW